VTDTMIGLNMKYLPWQLFVPLVIGISLVSMYGAITIKGKGKEINIFFFCMAISLFFLGIETLAKSTGIFVQYLPIIEPIYWGFACITIIFMVVFSLLAIVS